MATKEAALVDCGSDQPRMFVNFAEANDLAITKIFETHAHIDHVAGLAKTKTLLPHSPVYLHELELPAYSTAAEAARRHGIDGVENPPPPDFFVDTDDTIELGELSFQVLHTPGHSPGHICFLEDESDVMFCGDLYS